MNYQDHPIFDNYAAFNRYQVYDGMRKNESGTTPSVYITEIKLKKAYARLMDNEIEHLHGDELNAPAIARIRKLLIDKMDELWDWQLFEALRILLKDDNYHSAAYVLKCQRQDKPLIRHSKI